MMGPVLKKGWGKYSQIQLSRYISIGYGTKCLWVLFDMKLVGLEGLLVVDWSLSV